MVDDIEYLSTIKEGENIELKECSEKIPLSFYESYSAMANGSGGCIYLGIIENDPENIISGIENAPQKKKQLCNALTMKSKIANNVFSSSDISIIDTPFGSVIKVKVQPVPIDQRPVYLNGDVSNSYKRVHEGDKLLDEEEIRSMVNDASKNKFDQRPNEFGFGLEDMDQSAIEDYIENVKNTKKIPFVENMEPFDILSRVGALVVDKESGKLVMTNGAAAFFGKSYVINSVCPSLWMDYQETANGDNRFSNRITVKDLSVEPNIYNFYRRVFPRLCELLPAPFYLENGVNVGKRILVEIAREAFANTISNVDLHSPLGAVIVKTPMSLSFKNAGGILTGMAQALKGGVSIPRNPCVFNFFLALGIIDHGGYGIPNIFEKMKALKYPRPELEESWNRDQTSLKLVFTEMESPNEEDQKSLIFLSIHPEGISTSDLAKHLLCSNEKARQILTRLIASKKAVDNGKAKKGKLYYLSENVI